MPGKPVYSASGSGKPLYVPGSGKPAYDCAGVTAPCTNCNANTAYNAYHAVFGAGIYTNDRCDQCTSISGSDVYIDRIADNYLNFLVPPFNGCTWFGTFAPNPMATCLLWFYVVLGTGGWDALLMDDEASTFTGTYYRWSLAEVTPFDCSGPFTLAPNNAPIFGFPMCNLLGTDVPGNITLTHFP
jgi:hypothetical protein